MDRNSIIGFVLIALILFGFMGYQSRQVRKQQEIQAQLDSARIAEEYAQWQLDSAYKAEHPEAALAPEVSATTAPAPQYSDESLNTAAQAEAQTLMLENSKLQVAFTTRGAQPLSVRVKDYTNYDKSDLYILKEGKSELGYTVYAPTAIDTRKFTFQYVAEESSDSTVVMRLPVGEGYIQQKYTLLEDSYSLNQEVSFVGMNLDSNRSRSISVDFQATLPRMEKGYKNETQYSRLNYYFPDDKKPENIGNGRKGSKRFNNNIEWFAFQQQFFSAIMRAPENFNYGEFAIDFVPKDSPSHDLMNCSAKMQADLRIEGGNGTANFEFYFGPNNYKGLKAYGHAYEKVIPLGGKVIGLFTKWIIIPMFDWLHRGITNFGIIILLMTIIIKIVVLPMAYKSYASSAKTQALKPFIDKINAKYPKQEDSMKKQQETMELYKKAGVNMMGGCLPMLLQLPILWAMFRFFPASIELRQQPFLWAEDLSAYDDVIHWGTSVLGMDHISIFALLMAVSMFFYSKATMQSQNTGNDPNAKMMKAMSLYMMPIMMFFICNNLSSGLSYYYLLSNLITMLETWIIRKWIVKPEEIIAKVKAAENKPVPKSKWQQRLEEAQKMQRQMQQEQAKKNRR
ncbi:MAG: membrane protein insertase YidC [Bacteroidales bacterium]|nr:membrane protein insertase YidC [Bacteroidales bacterium]